jgi:hypothetical protein
MVKRGIVDTLLRGLDNTLANWPVLLLRLGEALLFVAMAIGSVLAIVAPIAVALGVQFADVDTPEEVLDVMAAFIQRWVLILWIFLAVTVLLLVFVVIHSFVAAACARIAVDADRAAGPATKGLRARFRVFTMSRWLAGGAQGCWPVFWIYNLAWGLAGLVLLIPILPTFVLLLFLAPEENPAAAIAIGCGGIALTILLGIACAIVTSIWTNRAIAGWTAQRESPREALRTAWRALRMDLARHALIALAIFVVAGAGSSFFASFSMFATFGETMGRSSMVQFFTMPVRLFGWLASSAFSAAITTWFVASYAALTCEE